MRRYLFGPVTAAFANDHLRRERRAGYCLAFDPAGATDLTIAPADTWEEVCARLPPGWVPDFVALDLHYSAIPACLWSVPVPLVGLAADWTLLWHHYRRRLPCCDLVLTDVAGVEALHRAGIPQGRAANLFGLDPSLLAGPSPEGPRDLDVLFAGNLQAAVQRERLAWLGRLARLGDRWRVVVATGVFGEDYRRLLGRARIVFNRSIRGECNMRAFEAVAAGALLFQEEGNREVPAYFRDRQECVCYNADNLEELLAYYLEHEEERRAIAAAARAKLPKYTWDALWDETLALLEREWPEVEERSRQRPRLGGSDELLARTWEALSAATCADTTLVTDLEAALRAEPNAAELHNALGLAVTRSLQVAGPVTATLVARVPPHFRRALEADPDHLLAGLNLAEALVGSDRPEEATEVARRTLDALQRQPEADLQDLDGGHFPPAFDHFRVEWERAAWENSGQPAAEVTAKQTLLRWRLHDLLAYLTGGPAYAEAAAEARPDLPCAQAALGCAWGRAGQPDRAVGPLRQAVAGNPFDLPAARALFQALGEVGDREGQQRLAAERRLLAKAAPQVVPAEKWFLPAAPPPPTGGSPTRVQTLSLHTFHQHFGSLDTRRAVCSFTPPPDTHVVLTLLAHSGARRILEIGTAAGHMTANFTEWSPDDALVFTLGTVAGLPATAPPAQRCEDPDRAHFGRCTNHFGKADKVLFITADSLPYDFRRLGPLDFAFIDGAHDRAHVLSDTLKVYGQLRPGGCLVWHDFGSAVPWVEVRQALAETAFAEAIYHVEGTGVAFLHKGEVSRPAVAHLPATEPRTEPAATGHSPAGPAAQPRPLAVVWEGPLLEVQSLALVNRQLCLGLLARGHDLSLLPAVYAQGLGGPTLPGAAPLTERIRKPLERPADVHVRHEWPPNFTPPPEGHWVLMQHWEFGSPPRAWMAPLKETIDEVWVASRFVRDCLIQAGAPAERVQVIPLGVDPRQFHPEAPPLPLRTRKRFKFLFVGGTIRRKGIDLLLEAYTRTFTVADDVCLVIKDMGIGSFYRGQTAGTLIAAYQQRSDCPEIEYLDAPLSEEELPGLYTACDCLVLPYRGEGFGLPVAEALACARAVIVTGQGAALDFCDDSNAYLIPAQTVRLAEKRVGDLETVDYPWWAEPDPEELGRLLRRVLEAPEERQAKGAAGRARIMSGFTWEHATAAVEHRLQALREQPVRRLLRGVSRAPTRSRARVSLCLIVKDEEENLPACLSAAADLVDEVVVVDTGSTDGTRDLATRFGARVFDFPWVDSFAAARNECLRHATGEWIFWMDADDRLDEDNRRKLRTLFAGLNGDNAAYAMKCLCLPDPVTRTSTAVDHVRLFRNHPEVRWQYRVHEQILPAVRRLGGEVRWSDVVVQHAGYQDPALRRRKLDRDLRLLRLEDAEHPDDPFTLFNLGSVYQELGQPAEALHVLRRSLERSHPSDSIVRKLHALIVQCHRRLGQEAEAVAACQAGRRHYPDDAELLFQEAELRRRQGDRSGAIAALRHILDHREAAHFASIDTGVRGYKARHNLAVLLREENEDAEAEAQWRTAVAEQPHFAPAWLGLGELYLAQRHWEQLEQVAQHLQGEARGEGTLLRARGHLARREFVRARALLAEAIHQDSRALWPRVILSHTLLQEGQDWEAAACALRDVLALDPNNSEARHNLGLLLRQHGHPVDNFWV